MCARDQLRKKSKYECLPCVGHYFKLSHMLVSNLFLSHVTLCVYYWCCFFPYVSLLIIEDNVGKYKSQTYKFKRNIGYTLVNSNLHGEYHFVGTPKIIFSPGKNLVQQISLGLS